MHRFNRIWRAFLSAGPHRGGASVRPLARAAENLPPLDYILKEVEKRYTGSQFSADFLQESTIKSMEITDFASGRLYVRYPGMMRWEYEKPERQVIITDGKKLWIYRPQDNQVMVGGAPVFFRDGKGASFLSDIRLVRKKFNIQLARAEGEYLYELRMKPIEGDGEHLRDPPLRHPARPTTSRGSSR
ncbi:MAG: outer membrane lipoprotein carrier protein LolA [Desulfobacterales bacterium]|nr:outer membrane lipoprotein carrier protein LolA [Desulfobacterales bacterium]